MRKLFLSVFTAALVVAQVPANPKSTANSASKANDAKSTAPAPVKPKTGGKETNELPTAGGVFSSTTHVVLVPVTVQDRAGNSVPGLTPYDFRLYDNKKPQAIKEDLAQHPVSVVVVIQANADVEAILPQIMKQSTVLEHLVVGSDGEVAVIAFDHRIQTLTGFTADEAQIDSAFHKLHAGSYTAALNNAALAGITMLRTRPTERRRVMLVISENRDKGSDITARRVLQQAEIDDVLIYTMDISQLLASLTGKAQPNRPDNRPPGAVFTGPGGYVNTPTVESQNDMGNWVPAIKDVFEAAKGVFVADPLDVYAHYTGGRECGFKSTKALATCVEQIGDELHSQYLLSYTPEDVNEPGLHQITVEVLKPGFVVRRARPSYWSAGTPQ